MQAEQIKAAVKAAGIVGAGGAGFPAHVKLQAQVEVVIANGCECEPLLCTDQYLMRNQAQAVVNGLLLAMKATGAKRGVIALKEKYSTPLEALRKAGAGCPEIEFHLLPNYYPMGDEQILTYLVTKRLVPAGGIPAQVGVLVHNVSTLVQISRACENGEPVTRREVAVLGEVNEPKVLNVPLGTAISQVIDWAGGPRIEDAAVLAGGPLMGNLISDMNAPIIKTSGALLILPAYHPLIISKRKSAAQALRQAQAYCQACGSCEILCSRQQLGHALRPQRLLRAANCAQEWEVSGVLACSQCNLCAQYACPMGLSPSMINAELKKYGRKAKTRAVPDHFNVWRYPLGVPGARLLQHLGLGKYEGVPSLDCNYYSPSRVSLLLKQHVGVPAVPVVHTGDKVKVGELLARVAAGKLGADVHASIDGVVEKVDQERVVIAS